ncbi:helix-turn-helix domain-containing protein [Mobilicoccus caccae]|uniref:HTH araC/xylS-type domain-containing protein n=1 Tax=Mobilicoccus caccae TaxID=1859295 RepID=A0ABQ6IT73_9MICO|nr:AraC family transcriptional regulator [Mobilicoccus caccae]GMA40352.1 hypothetical protein GCM10025883_23970 [Mobilicoccus caccae]
MTAAYDAAAFIREHVREQIRLEDVADAVGYSPFHLARMFTASVRCSPMRYLAAHRFHQAKHLLLAEGLTVVDVCHEVGFSSPGTFTRRFRAEVGVTPAELRVLADEVTERHAAPFRSGPQHGWGMLTGTVEVARELGPDPLVWVGLFARPEPAGVPAAGLLRRGPCEFTLPVLPTHPWLLATVVPDTADPLIHLAADWPLVAMHPAPITRPTHVRLTTRPAFDWETPILTALPALRKIGVSGS